MNACIGEGCAATDVVHHYINDSMTREEFIANLQELKADFEQKKAEWANHTLEDYFDAMIAYAQEIQGFYDNMKMSVDADEPTWENFFNILKGAAVYE